MDATKLSLTESGTGTVTVTSQSQNTSTGNGQVIMAAPQIQMLHTGQLFHNTAGGQLMLQVNNFFKF